MIGLRDFHKTYKGASFGYRLRELRWQLRYAWQRAWRGYSDVDVFDFSYAFMEKIVLILKDFRKNNIALWIEDKGSDAYTQLDKTQTDAILDKMIALAENSNSDAWVDMGLNPQKPEDMIKIEEFERNAEKKLKEFLEMFAKYFQQMWY